MALVTLIQAALEWSVYSAGLFGEDPAAATLLKPLTLAWYLAIASLTAATVQQDPLPGADQDWLIRPIKRSHLLLAKLAFLAAVISAPMLVANVFDALANGFSPAASLMAALWKECFVFACFIVPTMALASLARSAAELVMIGAGLMVAFALSVTVSALFLGADWCPTCNSGVSWLQHVMQHVGILAGASIILGLQYFKRRSAPARWIALAGAVLLVVAQLPWSWAFAIEQRITQQTPATTISINLAEPVRPSAANSDALRRGAAVKSRLGKTLDWWRRRLGSGTTTTLGVPLKVEGLADDELLLADRVEVALADEAGHSIYRGDNAGALAALLSAAAASQSIEVSGRGSHKPAATGQQLQLQVSLSLMKQVADYKIAAVDGDVRDSAIGHCATLADRNYIYLRCKAIAQSPFCYSAALVAGDGTEKPLVLRCVPDYRRHLPAFMEIMGFYGIDLPLHEKNADPATLLDNDLSASYIKLRIYGEETHFVRSLESDPAIALLNFSAAKSQARDQ